MSKIETTRITKGGLVEVEVHGLPADNTFFNVFTYRAGSDVTVGELVAVPAPDWSIRVTGRDVLPGFVLGATPADGRAFETSALRTTMPLCGPEAHAEGVMIVKARETAARWREQSQALSEASAMLGQAADLMEKAAG